MGDVRLKLDGKILLDERFKKWAETCSQFKILHLVNK